MAIKVRRIDFSPDEWLGGTRGLTFEQEGFYIRVCALIYSNGGPLPPTGLSQRCEAHPRQVGRLLRQLLKLGKIRENDDGTLTVPRCEIELASARLRADIGEKSAAKRWGNNDNVDAARGPARERARGPQPTSPGLLPDISEKNPSNPAETLKTPDAARGRAREAIVAKARHLGDISGFTCPKPAETLETGHANHQPSGRKIASPKELAILSSVAHGHARDDAASAVAMGDGGAAPRSPTPETAAAPAAIDPELRAYGEVAFERCLEILNGKRFVFDSETRALLPPDPRVLEFRARLSRINTSVGERLRGNARLQAWDIIGQADAIGDPDRIPAEMLAALASLEGDA